LKTKLIATMKMLRRILHLVIKLNELVYLFDARWLLQRRKSGRYYCPSESSLTKMGCCIHILSRSLKQKQNYSIWRFIMSCTRLLFIW
jgi:hypothetical protein